MNTKPCTCNSDNRLAITCSGAADVGYVADQTARKLSRNNTCKMSCLALFSTCNDEKIEELKSKDILVIDGCSEDCGKKTMEQRGIKNYRYLRVTDLGYEKGKTTTSRATIEAVTERAIASFLIKV